MRTTLTLDDDVMRLLQEEMERSRRPFKEVVNQTLRLGLRSGAGPRKPFKIRPHSFGFKPGIDQDKLGQLDDELQTEAFLERHGTDLRKQ